MATKVMYPSSKCRYTREHIWVYISGDVAVLGITDFQQNELGEIITVQLPEVGQSFQASDVITTLESVETTMEVRTPHLFGEVVEVNTSLSRSPKLINSHARSYGWLVKIRIASISEANAFMDENQYNAYLVDSLS